MSCLSESGYIVAAHAFGDDMIRSMKVSESEGYKHILRSFCLSGKVDEAQALMEETTRKKLLWLIQRLMKSYCKGCAEQVEWMRSHGSCRHYEAAFSI